MYNKYLISLYARELKNYDKAAAIAEKEVNNRPTPETYNWLAWTYFKKGDISKAAELTETHVLNKTFEPEALLHSAYILKAKGDLKESRKLFNECKTASFELGPVTTKKIEMNL
jgi:tetratricopeptide (TPR) repeat protein